MAIDLRAATPARWARFASGGTWGYAPHLLLINRVLMAAAAGEEWANRVIFQLPPRHGKSEIISGYFPSWYLGLHPDHKIILASYEATFASTWGQRNRELLEAYGPSIFGCRVRQDSRAKADWSLANNRGGMFTTGVGGPITGRGAHGVIIDDPVKNAQDALSPTVRRTATEWWTSTVRTRLEPKAWVMVIQTRWHEEDLAGWLQGTFPDDWLVISLPAIAEADEVIYLPDDPSTPAWTRKAGEPLWPERFDLETLAAIRHELGGPGGHWWLSLYQQRPTPVGGGVLKPEDFRRFTLTEAGYLLDRPDGPKLVASSTLRRFATMDLASTIKTRSDFTVIAIFGLAPPDLLLLDVLRKRMEGPDLPRVAARVYQAYRPAYFGVEATGFQISTVQDMRRGNPAEGRIAIPVKALHPQGDKVSRALTLAARMGGGHVYTPKAAPWLAELETEMELFPLGAHDDQVDTLAYGALEAVQFGQDFLVAE